MPDIGPIEFRGDMEADGRMLVDVKYERVLALSGLKGYYRFGEGNPVVRFEGHEGDPWKRSYVFVTQDGHRVPYDTPTLTHRMLTGTLQEVRPFTVPATLVREGLDRLLSMTVSFIAETIEFETGLARPSRAVVARERTAAAGLLDAIEGVPDGRAGIQRLRELLLAHGEHETEGVRIRAGARGRPKGSEVRHKAMAQSILTLAGDPQKASHLGTSSGSFDLEDGKARLRAALGEDPDFNPKVK